MASVGDEMLQNIGRMYLLVASLVEGQKSHDTHVENELGSGGDACECGVAELALSDGRPPSAH